MRDKLQEAQWKLEGKCPGCGKYPREHTISECDYAFSKFRKQIDDRIKKQGDWMRNFSDTTIPSQLDRDSQS